MFVSQNPWDGRIGPMIRGITSIVVTNARRYPIDVPITASNRLCFFFWLIRISQGVEQLLTKIGVATKVYEIIAGVVGFFPNQLDTDHNHADVMGCYAGKAWEEQLNELRYFLKGLFDRTIGLPPGSVDYSVGFHSYALMQEAANSHIWF